MSDVQPQFAVLRQTADPATVDAIERLVRDGEDRALNRINVFDFAARNGLEPQNAIAAFLHAARLGLFDMSWNVLCPGCGGVLGAGTSLKSVHRDHYSCALCAAGYEATLDEMVEVTFTVSRACARSPRTIPARCRSGNISARFSGVPALTCRRIPRP